MTLTENRIFILLLSLSIFAHFSGLFVTIMGPDGALYASISRVMVEKQNYLDLYAQGKDWLDKPHMPFWITAIFFKLFGFTTWAYKLPAILMTLLGAWYTYLYSRKWYNVNIAKWAVIIYLTGLHLLLSDNDVRAEPYLTAFIIASLYHFSLSIESDKLKHLLAGSLFAACAIMTKGIFTLIPIGGGILISLIIQGRWKDILQWKWIAAAFFILIFISPEIYALYHQFDRHPEKVIFGNTGVSGIRFFFWDSQFGRFTNSGPIKGKGDLSFYLHTTLWAFLPWSLLLYAAIYSRLKNIRSNIQKHESFLLWGALFTFLVFSISKFQLPHYINILFPFFAILTSAWIDLIFKRKFLHRIKNLQYGLSILCWIAIPLLIYLYDPEINLVTLILLFLVLILVVIICKHKRPTKHSLIVPVPALSIIALFIFLTGMFYPDLMRYQSGSEAARYLNSIKNTTPVILPRDQVDHAFEFYYNGEIIFVDSLAQVKDINTRPALLLAPEHLTSEINGSILKSFAHFHVSKIDGKFINKETRNESLSTKVLIDLK
ncbi:MAG: ArnT family glycosyltransferase [Chitinophagaceae bacterium]